ncbi:MAG: hypothetical protein K1000chlam1_00246 [Candidatus Anoxychlamydiales bacterium]|nr:hypothetical protein [Candidatus Anoxychlamydiales bacterium]
MNDKRQFGELESFILQEIKKKNKATVKDIHILLKKSIAYTTIMTVINRLYEKKILKREKISRSYIYWLSDSNYFSKFLDRIKKKIFSGNSIEMVSYLLENNSKITKEELNKIDELIQKMKKEKK